MKKLFFILYVLATAITASASEVDYNNCFWLDSRVLSRGGGGGICAVSSPGSNSEDDTWLVLRGYGSYINAYCMYSGSNITIETGFVNIKRVVFLFYKYSPLAPMIPSVGGDLVYTNESLKGINDNREEDYIVGTWTNPGRMVGSLTFTVGDKATLSGDSRYLDYRGEADIVYLLLDLGDAEDGACGVPIPKDTVTLQNPQVTFEDHSDPELGNLDFVLIATDKKAGCSIHYPYELYWEDELDMLGEGEVKTVEMDGGAYVQAGDTRYELDYGVMTIGKNQEKAGVYDFHLDVIAKNGTRYFMNWTGGIVAANERFAKEPMTPTTFNLTFDRGDFEEFFAFGTLQVYLWKGNDFIQLEFVQNKMYEGTVIAPGVHQINDSGEKGTASMSPGFQDERDNSECAYFINSTLEEWGYNPETAYFFKSGTVTVEKTAKGVKITVDAVSHYGSKVNAVYEGKLRDLDEVTGLAETAEAQQGHAGRCTVLGLPCPDDYRGVVIEKGRKYLIR